MSHDAFVNDLSQRWIGLTGRYSNDAGLIRTFFAEIETAYNSPGRYYHSLHHIGNLLNLADQYQNELHDKEIIDFVIYYHDIIYDVARSDNEERSAAIAGDRLTVLKLPQKKIVSIVRYIIASKTHELNEADRQTDLAWFLDFDMSALGADWGIYYQYLQDVRKEYSIYPNHQYKTGRSRFLQRTLSMPFVFNTSQFRKDYEERARANMQKELNMLNKG